ncbi:MAG TPA: MFS transporter, partial [Nakamurella sp.]
LDALVTVHESAGSAGTQQYRHVLGLDQRGPRTAVIVQRMVDAQSAGVMFTRDPVTGNNERVIESAWGLGEAVVSGIVTPDHFRLSSAGEIVERRVAAKEIAVRYAPGGREGTVQMPPPPAQARRSSLTDTQLRELALLAEQCERHFGGPQDVEWAFTDGSLVLLQSRPITRMGSARKPAAAAEPEVDPQPPERLTARRMTGLLLAAVLTPLNSTIVAVALPAIAADFDSSPADVTRWIVTSYLAVCIVAQSPAGRAADLWGYGRILTLGRLTFVVGALAAALSPDLSVLAVGRVLMAVGGALTIPTVFAELSNRVSKARRGFVFGLFGSAMGAAAAVGPLLGGFVTVHFGWHAVFYVSVPIIAVSFLLVPPIVAGRAVVSDDAVRRSPDAAGRGDSRPEPPGFDLFGIILLTLAILALVAAVERIRTDGVWFAFGAAVVGAAFVWRERRGGASVLDVRLFGRQTFAAGTAIIALHNLVLYSMLLLLPFLLVASGAGGSGAAALSVGGTLLLFTAAMVLAAPLGGHLSDLVGARIVAVGGSVLAASGGLVFAVTGGTVIAVPLLLMGAGVGLATGPAQAAALAAVRSSQAGAAAGALSTMRYLGGVVGSGLVALLADAGFRDDPRLLIFPAVLLVSAAAGLWLPGVDRQRSAQAPSDGVKDGR